ncbi:hypothetical protein HO409_07125 [Streptococcus suis]|nr:hypothetical protein [Streptococcus suis]
MSKFLFFCLYYTSFTPLWISILFIDIKSMIEKSQPLKTELISVIFILTLWLISFGYLILIISRRRKDGSIEVVLKSVQEEKTITSEYLLSYILPLFAFDFTRWDSFILFLVFFTTLGYLCIKHKYFSVNIVLEILNYNIYYCELENSDNIRLSTHIISKRNLSVKKGDKINLRSLNNEYKLDVF